jgi:hypothetical protein
MVELYSLKLLGNELTGIDQDVAQLEFESSTIEQSSIFASMAIDANLISTDSLDMEKLHLQCETNKNDYKLTFEDSGQWETSSGIANSPDDDEEEEEDLSSGAEAPPTSLLLSPTITIEKPENGTETTNNLTTWGRIRSTEPFDDKTISLPELCQRQQNSTHSTASQQQRPASLVANFVERQPTDFEYSETYLGNGRYVDVNDNEIGFVPQSTSGIQRCRLPTTTTTAALSSNSYITTPLKPPRRTFADLGCGGGTTSTSLPRDDSGIEPTPLNEHAPDLKFLSLPFEVPAFCQQQPGPFHIPSLDEILRQTKKSHLSGLDDKIFNEKMSEFSCPDSGLDALSGPSHIDDWPSLAMLLPKHVVDACTFFKSNTHLLTGSTNILSEKKQQHFDRRPTTSSSASTIPRSSSNHLSSKDTTIDSGLGGSSRSKKYFCECQTQSLIAPPTTSPTPKSRLCLSSKIKLHAKELAIVGLPLYKRKQILVENVVEGVAEVVRGSSSDKLCIAFEALISDELNNGISSWDMIKTVTSPGFATSGQGIIHVVKELEACDKPINCRSQQFVKELLRLRSLDGWLSYAVLKENVLSRIYDENAFMMRANSAYRSLFWRLIESLELLSVIEQRPNRRDRGDSGVGQGESSTWGSASKIASDSRIPKSSSIPSKLLIAAELEPETLKETPPKAVTTPKIEEKPLITERPTTLQIEVEIPSAPASSQTSTPRSPRSPRSPRETTTTTSAIPVAAAVAPLSPSTSSQFSSSSMSPSASMRRSRIPMPTNANINNSSQLSTTILSRSKTPSIGTTTTTATPKTTTTALLNTASSPTRLPLFRRQYGSRAISQQRPYTTSTPTSSALKSALSSACRYDSLRRPTSTAATTTTTGFSRNRKYFA